MKAVRTMASFAILGSGLFLGYFIVKNSINVNNASAPVSVGNAPVETADRAPAFEPIDNLIAKSARPANGGDATARAGSMNLTATLAQRAFESLAKNQQGGKLRMPDEGELNQLLNDKNLDPAKDFNFGPTITDKDIIISKDSSGLAPENYVNIFNNLVDKYFRNIDALDALKVSSLEEIKQGDAIIGRYDQFISDFKNTAVPLAMATFHKRVLTLAMTERNVLDALRNYQNDPIKASVAIKTLPAVLKDFATLARAARPK